jgi:ATP-dependent exoDNAse (exonuclease V) beta subunit
VIPTHAFLAFLEEALRLYDLDFRVVGGRYFYLRQEVEQLASVLRAVDNPLDTVSLVAALRSPFFGASDEDILKHHCRRGRLDYLESGGAGPLAGAFRVLGELHRKRNRISVENLLHELYEATHAPVTYLLKPNGEQRVANLVKVADTARILSERGERTLRSFVRWLSQREAERAEEEEAATVEAGDQFVRVLTMHKAKGLEFPVVYMTDLCGGSRRVSEPLVVDRANGDVALAAGTRSAPRTMNYDRLMEQEEKRRRAERLRLLYVTMTRARDLLVIPAFWAAATETDREGRPRPNTLLRSLAGHLPAPGESEVDLPGLFVENTAGLPLDPDRPPPFRISVPSRFKPTGPGRRSPEEKAWEEADRRTRELARGGRRLFTPTEEVVSRPGSGGGRGMRFGTLVHRLMEIVDWEAPADLGPLAEALGTDLGLGMQEIRSAADMVTRVLAGDFIRRIVSSEAYYKEVPFAVEDAGGVLEGKIDALFRENGGLVVVDFKTDRVSPAEAASRAEHYRSQGGAYARAVHAALGRFPAVIFLFLDPMKAIELSM